MKNPQPPNEKRLKSKESLFYPSVLGSKWKTLDPDIRWDLSDILNHVFPAEYQEKSYEYAQKLMTFLLENPGGIDKKIMSDFVKGHEIPVSTLYNIVIPKLVKLGLVERRREPNASNPGKGWFLILKPSVTFSSHLSKLADEWRSIYKTAYSKKSSE
ncbi:MAG: hypothetical protein KAT37_02440 [Candidatus Aenigmarchaeota archaeon]|nr:hypothetical protein [Candidatus Aenigmarchaeota archaeon]